MSDEKEKPSLTVSQAKRTKVGKADPAYKWASGPIPEGERHQDFVCVECGGSRPIAEIGANVGAKGHAHMCKACVSKKNAVLDPSWRSSDGKTRAASLRGQYKQSKKKYLSGRLPKWMYD